MNRLYTLMLLAVLTIVFTCGWTTGAHHTGDVMNTDFDKIAAYADKHLDKDWRVTVRASGAAGGYRDEHEVRELGETVARKLGVKGEAVFEHSGSIPVYRVQAEDAALGEISIMAAGSDNQASRFVIVRLDGSGHMNRQALGAWEAAAKSVFGEYGVNPEWNVIAQGSVQPDVAATQYTDTSERLAAEAAHYFGAAEKERYTDQGTLSLAYDAPSFPASIQSGSHRITLQIAIHRDSDTGSLRMTIGTPVITTEY